MITEESLRKLAKVMGMKDPVVRKRAEGDVGEYVTEYVIEGSDGYLHPTNELIEKLSEIDNFEELRLFVLDEVNPYVPWLSPGSKSLWDRVRELSQAGHTDWAAVYQAYIDTYEHLMSVLAPGRGLSMKRAKEEEADDMRQGLIEFLADNPNPLDEEVHAWAEENGYETDLVESEIYKFATLYIKFLTGGDFNRSGISVDDVDPDELARGIEEEMKEHGMDERGGEKTALDHLSKIKDYYTRVKEMEKGAESS